MRAWIGLCEAGFLIRYKAIKSGNSSLIVNDRGGPCDFTDGKCSLWSQKGLHRGESTNKTPLFPRALCLRGSKGKESWYLPGLVRGGMEGEGWKEDQEGFLEEVKSWNTSRSYSGKHPGKRKEQRAWVRLKVWGTVVHSQSCWEFRVGKA